MHDLKVQIVAPPDGAADVIAAMNDDSRACIGQSTYYFVKRLLRNPEMRKLHEQKKVELEASGYMDKSCGYAIT